MCDHHLTIAGQYLPNDTKLGNILEDIKDCLELIQKSKSLILHETNNTIFEDDENMSLTNRYAKLVEPKLLHIKKLLNDIQRTSILYVSSDEYADNDVTLDKIKEKYKNMLEVHRLAIDQIERNIESRKREILLGGSSYNSKKHMSSVIATLYHSPSKKKKTTLENIKKTNKDLNKIHRDLSNQVLLSNEHIALIEESSHQITRFKDEFLQLSSMISNGYSIVRNMKLKQAMNNICYYLCFICYFIVVLYIVIDRF